MSLISETTGVLGLFGKGWDWLEDRLDPTRLSAKRLIVAFEAHGVARQQIIRLLPPHVLQSKPEVTMADFSSPKKLKHKLSPPLLDWAAEYLNIKRAWLDGVDEPPHHVVNHYKQPAEYRKWLEDRQLKTPHAGRWISVWKAKGQSMGPGGDEPLCLVYEETTDGLDGMEFSRYWLLSDEWSLRHQPCIENMVAATIVARSLNIVITGRDVPLDKLRRVVVGKMLIPDAARYRTGGWHPEDIADPLPGQDSEWRRAIREGAQAWLALSDQT
jgi:hypothetical protein